MDIDAKSVLVAQSSLNVCNPVDCSPTVSSVHNNLQARILQWAAIPFSMNLPEGRLGLNPGLPHCRQIVYHLSYQGRSIKVGSFDQKKTRSPV